MMRKKNCQFNYLSYLCIIKINDMETQVAYTNTTESIKKPRTGRLPQTNASRQTEIPKTPESELMSVDEYFGILHKMVDECYDSIQG